MRRANLDPVSSSKSLTCDAAELCMFSLSDVPLSVLQEDLKAETTRRSFSERFGRAGAFRRGGENELSELFNAQCAVKIGVSPWEFHWRPRHPNWVAI